MYTLIGKASFGTALVFAVLPPSSILFPRFARTVISILSISRTTIAPSLQNFSSDLLTSDTAILCPCASLSVLCPLPQHRTADQVVYTLYSGSSARFLRKPLDCCFLQQNFVLSHLPSKPQVTRGLPENSCASSQNQRSWLCRSIEALAQVGRHTEARRCMPAHMVYTWSSRPRAPYTINKIKRQQP